MDPITLGLLILAGTAGTEIGLGGVHVVSTAIKRARLRRRAQQDPAFAEKQRQREEEEQKRREEEKRQAEKKRKAEEQQQAIKDLIEGGERAQERDREAAEEARERDMDWMSQAAEQARSEPLLSLPLPLPLGQTEGVIDNGLGSRSFGPDGRINHDRLSDKANTLVSLLEHMNAEGDDVLLSALAGTMDVPLSAVQSPYVYVRMAEEMAERIDLLMLEVFSIASNERELIIEHAQKTEEREVCYPADRQSTEPYRDPSDIPQVIAEHQILLPDELYFQLLAANQLLVTRDYEEHQHGQILMLLVDTSGSMTDVDSRGLPRWVWAAGVTLGLLNKAILEKSTYFLRFFTSRVGALRRATNQEEAIILAQEVIQVMSSICRDGTDIPSAVYRGIEDIRTVPEISFAHILLITDGECDVDTNDLTEALGDRITLNAALVAVEENPELEAACQTYVNL